MTHEAHEAPSLSCKEQDEITRNTKKVKNDSIMEMERGQGSGSSSPRQGFGDAMDDEEGSDDEVENLREGFAAVRLSLREDYENVLKKGPWYVSGHFLSIRQWEPNFKPELASVSSVAVWVRLNQLLIEYYNAEALLQIGRSTGNVLRIDTHTAEESRARFACLCVQIDVDKPLIMTILIGKVQQPSSDREETVDRSDKACNLHEADTTRTEAGPSSSMQEEANGNVQEDQYGPWVVVTCKRNGTKTQKSGGPKVVHDNWRRVGYQGRDRDEWREEKSSGNDVGHIRPQREAKRKLSPLRVVEKAQLERVIQSISKVDKQKAQVQFGSDGGEAKEILESSRILKPTTRDSIRGKKSHARARAHLQASNSAVGRTQVISVQASEIPSNQNGGDYNEIIAGFKFAAPGRSEKEINFGRSACRDTDEQGVSNAGHGATRRQEEKGVDGEDQTNKDGDCALPDSGARSSCARPSYGDGSSITMCDAEAMDRMEFLISVSIHSNCLMMNIIA
nr:hypothetical protein CFP56_48935 [Quercus suber]